MAESYPLLKEVGPPRRGTKSRPAAGPVYTSAVNGGAAPSMPTGNTLYELFTHSAKSNPDARCLGHRPVVDGEAQPYVYQDYAQVVDRVAAIATGIKGLGLQTRDKVAVLGVNCPNWMITMQACNRNNFICVPLYETLGEDAIEYILGHSEARLVVVQGRRLGRVAKALGAVQDSQVVAIVHFGEGASGADIKAAAASGVEVLSFADLEAAGRKGRLAAPEPPKPEDLSTIMYTSGTTGNPKGVLLTHGALVAAIGACNTYLHEHGESLARDDCYFSFLPLAHVFDRLAEEFMLAKGGCIAYWQGEIPKVLADIAACRPTLFCGVPRVFDRIYAGINDQLAGSLVKRLVFLLCLARKKAYMAAGWRHDKASPLADLLVFNKIKQRLGGRVRLILSGAAPLSAPVQEFLAVAMCAPVLQGYGLTETCAASCIAEPFQWRSNGTVGGPLPGVEVRLEAVPEMGYDPAATPPRGENIFKLSQGEYVAVEKLEGVYKGAPLVEQVWVYGNSFEATLVAVVVPEEKKLLAWAGANGLPQDFKLLVSDPRVRAHVLAQLQATGHADRLKGFEVVKAVHLCAEQFTADNGLLTPTFKLKRAPLQQRFQGEIDSMYAALRAANKVGGLDEAPGGGKAAKAAGGAAKVTNLVARSGRGAAKVVAA
ncbi:hypothetical protein Rsub_10094 [Raphidocelis subcapitata]|uniref:AMP-dependent synthetase/ligase domain-containing protein n=1 Tax=Raphidocelis subcapitata TaxID=307507 RepID=A0A2V0PGP4_9CHLO|nr:hypothetical protein Rsub_10094 [Raphidocelis subcapitata]|eukprot:GBF97083.1 hypothetical protein Rsub_10094 [Raphidocelis subcapitata]